MRNDWSRKLQTAVLMSLGIASLGLSIGCDNPQFEAGTVKVDPRGQEAEPEAPAPIDPSTRETSEGGER